MCVCVCVCVCVCGRWQEAGEVAFSVISRISHVIVYQRLFTPLMQLLPLHLAFPSFGFVRNRSVAIWSVSWCQCQSEEKSVDWLVESCCV